MLCDLNRLVSALAEQYTVQVLGRIEMPIRFLRRQRFSGKRCISEVPLI